ncbi:MAG TPA: DNA polymerase III subunit alpha, partial [Microbacteriaceae bacterium]|nr:DNA polymerase III subunit alpha [Microbacteriaceae bacterium]
PEACDNTLLIAERCESEFNTNANFMPRFPVPDGESEESWFVKEVERGLHARYPQGISDEVRNRANYETDVIAQMGFSGYFLVVADFINWAKDNDIRVGPGRGSGAGSMAAYALRITDLDPLQHGLIFERFLNPDRVSMPDFDVDFDDRRRNEVIRYVTEKYGDERVAQIVTYGTIKSKQALKDASRVLGYPFGMGEKLTKAMPPAVMAKDIPLVGITDSSHQRYKEASEFRTLLDQDQDAKRIYETALGLEGLKRQWGVHAAGVIMSNEPLIDIIPVMKRDQDGQIVTQFDYPTCEALGLIKMDFLGLRNLTIVSDAIENIKLNTGADLDLETLELDDSLSYELLARGDTLGVFQLDGGPMRGLLKLMKPDSFEDISAVLALYRPGPMGADSHTNYALRKNGLQKITPIHPELEEQLEEILSETYGLIIYQEQVMSIAQKVAGFTLGQADILRRAMGKKKKEELDLQFEGFSDGMQQRGFSKAAVKALWDILLPFSDYAFNKAHSAAYGVISYWTAYLKAHYPSEYMAALLTSVGDSKDKLAIYLNECRRMGIKVLPPDVNLSFVNFTAVGKDIRFGLGAVRNVGVNVVSAVREAREKEGLFESFHDFLKKIPAQSLNKRTVESLIKSGAFDELGSTRRALMQVHEQAIDQAIKEKKDAEHGNLGFDFDSLFDDAAEGGNNTNLVPEMPEWNKKDKLAFEREMIGLYVSDHPLRGLEASLAKHSTSTVEELYNNEATIDGETVSVAGLLTNVQHRTAKSGNLYGLSTLEDFSGEVQLLFMGKTYQEFGDMLQHDAIVSVRGRANVRDDGISLHVYQIKTIESNENDSGELLISMPETQATEKTISELKDIFDRHTGRHPVQLRLTGEQSQKLFELPHKVDLASDIYGEIKALLGPRCLG